MVKEWEHPLDEERLRELGLFTLEREGCGDIKVSQYLMEKVNMMEPDSSWWCSVTGQ